MADLAGKHLDHVEAHGNVGEPVFLQVQLDRAQYLAKQEGYRRYLKKPRIKPWLKRYITTASIQYCY